MREGEKEIREARKGKCKAEEGVREREWGGKRKWAEGKASEEEEEARIKMKKRGNEGRRTR